MLPSVCCEVNFEICRVVYTLLSACVVQDPSAKIGSGCRIGPSVVIGPNVTIEDGIILPQTYSSLCICNTEA